MAWQRKRNFFGRDGERKGGDVTNQKPRGQKDIVTGGAKLLQGWCQLLFGEGERAEDVHQLGVIASEINMPPVELPQTAVNGPSVLPKVVGLVEEFDKTRVRLLNLALGDREIGEKPALGRLFRFSQRLQKRRKKILGSPRK